MFSLPASCHMVPSSEEYRQRLSVNVNAKCIWTIPCAEAAWSEREALRKWSELPGTRPGLLYIAGHADSPESGLGTEKIDIDTLSEGHLPEIVVLNGCWTGATRPVYGRDPFSLAVGSLVGGARQAIAGCGSIGSEASAYVGVELLQRLSEGHDAASALRLAQITVRERYPEVGPMDWGGLMTIG